MKRYPVGSYEETRQSLFKRFVRLSPDQKLDWLSSAVAFIDSVNPGARWRRVGLPVPHRFMKRRKR
jgi:hypothetical protein